MATLSTYVRTAAPLLGVYEQGTADAGVNTVSQLVCTTSLASGASLKSSAWSAELFNGKWLYMPGAAAADRSRLIKSDGGFDPGNGYLLPDLAWGTDPDLLSDRTFEITSLFSGTDLRALVNEALKRVFVLRDLTFTVSHANVRKHQLNANAAWLKSWTWVYQLGHLASGESWTGTTLLGATDPYARSQTGKGYDRAGQVWIEGPSWQTTDTPYALCACRAYDLCRATSGTYGDQSGLTLETDEAPVDELWLAWRVILEAKKRLDHLERLGQASQEAIRAKAIALDEFRGLTEMYWQEPERTFYREQWIGPTGADSWAPSW